MLHSLAVHRSYVSPALLDHVAQTRQDDGSFVYNLFTGNPARTLEKKLKAFNYRIDRLLPRRNSTVKCPNRHLDRDPAGKLVESMTVVFIPLFLHEVIYQNRAQLPDALNICNDLMLYRSRQPGISVGTVQENQGLLYDSLSEYRTLRRKLLTDCAMRVNTLTTSPYFETYHYSADFTLGTAMLLVRGKSPAQMQALFAAHYPQHSAVLKAAGGYMFAEDSIGGGIVMYEDGETYFKSADWYENLAGFADFQSEVIANARLRKLSLLLDA